MTVPSFERFDYQLRSNKHIERKLVFDLLMRAMRRFEFSSYRYLGLGSLWFADHRLAHRLLGIDNLLSIEEREHADRADFNKPYASVKVLPGNSSEVLATFQEADWKIPHIVWMDYDGNLDESICGDLEHLLEHLAPDSVLILTINANRSHYRVRPGVVDAAQAEGKKIDPRAVATLASYLGDAVPVRYLGVPQEGRVLPDVNEDEFPACMAESLLAFLKHKLVASSRTSNDKPLRFSPLFNFCHQDNAAMVTVGGAITTPQKHPAWLEALVLDECVAVRDGEPEHHRLDLIPITVREKLLLDSLLPHVGEEQFPQKAIERGIKIAVEQVEKYGAHYRHFPIFVESPI